MAISLLFVMSYYVYILESESSGQWYCGFSENLKQRVADHQSNRAKHTRLKGPWRLIFSKEFVDKTAALQFEKYLKSTRNKDYIKRKFGDHFM